jgi:ASC-1-like (ASCH) protein
VNAMTTIEKKCWPEYFQAILNGEKTFEVRLADFQANKGDILLLREYNPKTKQYTGREIKKEITYISKLEKLKEFWRKEEIEKYGIQVIGFK